MPWVWIRRQIAKSWGITPRAVDESEPLEEVNIELRLMMVEAEAQQFTQQHPEMR